MYIHMGWSASDDARTLTLVKKTVTAFKNHLLARYPNDPRTKALIAKLHDVKLIPHKADSGGVYNSGGFNHSTGTLMVAAREGDGDVRTVGSLNKTILHELAHATRFKYIGETSHSVEWKSAFEFFLKVATNELGLPVELNCSAVQFYGIDAKGCPGCVWTVNPSSCPGFSGPPVL